MGKGIMSSRYPPIGAAFENIVLKNTKNLFEPSKKSKPLIFGEQNYLNRQKKRSSIYNNDKPSEMDTPEANPNTTKWSSLCWSNPPRDNLAVEFCEDTSIDGLKFVTQKDRHLSERIFWIIAFCLGVVAAVILINDVWRRYKENPVIVSFQPKEQDMDTIPFPAVTFCNINKFPKKKVLELQTLADSSNLDEQSRITALKQLIYVRSVCNAQQSFAKVFDFAHSRGQSDDIGTNDTIDENEQDDLVEFIRDSTIPCDQLLHLCIFGEEIMPCKTLFKPIVTDYGKCCTFNILPLPLLHTDPSPDESENSKSSPQTSEEDEIWNKTEIDMWKLWKYDEGLTIMDKNAERPYRQKRAGMPYGLSVLIDPHLNESYCPASDSEGFRFILHTSLEMPHVMEFSSILELGKEVFIEVHPDVTNADDDIRSFEREERQCYFAKEKKLQFFQPYTGSNCIDECSALIITKRCNCSFFYMPRHDGVKVCNNQDTSADRQCIELTRVDLLETLKEECGHCDSLCEDIAYNFETTTASLQKASNLWKDRPNKDDPNFVEVDWANNKMSIVHIYLGSETTVPKLRKRMYGDVDLIASTGGLLGLCLGVSVLSAVEAIYFLTLRAFWKYCRQKRRGKAMAKKFVEMLKGRVKKKRVINLDPNHVQFYPGFYPQQGQLPGYKGTGFQNQFGIGNKVYD